MAEAAHGAAHKKSAASTPIACFFIPFSHADRFAGLNPAAAGTSLRIPIPELSEERRRDMVKLVKQLAEEGKVRVRAARKDGMDAAKKMKANNVITEDEQKDIEKEVQALTDKYVKEVDAITASKEAELMKV